MTPQYKATEFSFRSKPHEGVDTYPSALTEHLRDHARDNWRVQQIFHVRQEQTEEGAVHQHFGVLWMRGSTPDEDTIMRAMQLRGF